MKKFLNVLVTLFFIIMVVFSTCFSLGVFDNRNAVPVFNETHDTYTYEGDTRGGRYDGNGEVFFTEGSRYTGGFSVGRFNGAGRYDSSEGLAYGGWYYSGVFQNGQAVDGTFESTGNQIIKYTRGVKTDSVITDDWRFDGYFNINGQSGDGSFTFADGTVYTGGFARGLADGNGQIADASGAVLYSGGFKAGFFEGQGKYTHPDGWIYEGTFLAGLFDGEGAVTIDGKTIRGVWKKGTQIKRYE
jgi:hypothetical protein